MFIRSARMIGLAVALVGPALLHPTAQSPRREDPGLHPTAQSPRRGDPGLAQVPGASDPPKYVLPPPNVVQSFQVQPRQVWRAQLS